MNVKMNGKKVFKIFFPSQEVLTSSDESDDKKLKLHLSATHHGDRDEFWIVATANGEETERHNCKFLESIQWYD